jgi:hypothetical protein
MREPAMIDALRAAAGNSPAAELLEGLFGTSRRLYKRLAQYSIYQGRGIYTQLARRPYAWLTACAEHFARQLSTRLGRIVAPHEVLIDSPPLKLEVQFHVDVYDPSEGTYRPLRDVSPVVRTLAEEQFDDYVKRVRVFVHPKLSDELQSQRDIDGLLVAAISATDA